MRIEDENRRTFGVVLLYPEKREFGYFGTTRRDKTTSRKEKIEFIEKIRKIVNELGYK